MIDRTRPTVLITGASTGIGKEFARIFSEHQYQLILVARDRERLKALAEELLRLHLTPTQIEICDLSIEEELENLVSRLNADRIVIDILINNAGVGVEGAFLKTDGKRELKMMDLNMRALVRLTKAFLPQMIERRSGKILQVASTAAFQPGPYLSVYFATKAFVLSFGEAISAELKNTGVSVTVLCPGPTHTEFERRLGTDSGLFESGMPVADARDVARAGYEGLIQRKRIVVPGLINNGLSRLSGVLPRALVLYIMEWVIRRNTTLRPRKPKNIPSA